MMQTILCMNPGERRPLKVFQVAPGCQPLDCDSLTRLGYLITIESDRPEVVEVLNTEHGRLVQAGTSEQWNCQVFLLRAEMENSVGDVVALGTMAVMVVPIGWSSYQDLAFAPGETLAEGTDEPSLIQVVSS